MPVLVDVVRRALSHEGPAFSLASETGRRPGQSLFNFALVGLTGNPRTMKRGRLATKESRLT
jgi:hypothetical protein